MRDRARMCKQCHQLARIGIGSRSTIASTWSTMFSTINLGELTARVILERENTLLCAKTAKSSHLIEIQPAHTASESSRAHHRLMDQHRHTRDVTRSDTSLVLEMRDSARRASSTKHRNRWHRKHPQTGDEEVEVSSNTSSF